VHVHAVDARAVRVAGPSAAQERNLVTALREATEDLVQVNLGAAGLWILEVLPVYEEKTQTLGER
jgi:hypothetical protein